MLDLSLLIIVGKQGLGSDIVPGPYTPTKTSAPCLDKPLNDELLIGSPLW